MSIQCSVACGEGIQTRIVECYHVADHLLINESFCIHNISTPKPKIENSCRGTSCIGKWGFDEWSQVYYTETLFMHHMIHHLLYCSVKHQLAMRQEYNTETFIVTMGAEEQCTTLTSNVTKPGSPLLNNHVRR